MAVLLRQQGHLIYLDHSCWLCALGALLPGRRHYIICAFGKFFFILSKITEIEWKVPSCECKEAFTGPFLIREHRNEGNILRTTSCRSADLNSVLQVKGVQLDCSAHLFPMVPFHPHGKCTLLNSSSRWSKWSCEWMQSRQVYLWWLYQG